MVSRIKIKIEPRQKFPFVEMIIIKGKYGKNRQISDWRKLIKNPLEDFAIIRGFELNFLKIGIL